MEPSGLIVRQRVYHCRVLVTLRLRALTVSVDSLVKAVFRVGFIAIDTTAISRFFCALCLRV